MNGVREIEVKYQYWDTDRTHIEQTCRKLGFVHIKTVTEHDIYYTPSGRNLLKEGTAFRLRSIMEGKSANWEITYKGPNLSPGGQDREELEVAVQNNGALLPRILEHVGFIKLAEIHKTRAYFHHKDITICIDSVVNLGEYLEVEILGTEESSEEVYNKIGSIIDAFGLAHMENEPRTYLEMLLTP